MSDEPFELEQIPFRSTAFADNPEPRCPCVLLLDTSGSMAGAPLDALNRGYDALVAELCQDKLAAKRVELCVVTFGPVQVRQDFANPESIYPEAFETTGDTPMGAAIKFALDELEGRKRAYREAGISYYRPWIFLITDGEPTDSWTAAASRIREGEAANAFALFAVGVKGADMETLAKISVRPPMKLEGLKFAELFRWLSNSLKAVSQSSPGERVALPAPAGWTEV